MFLSSEDGVMKTQQTFSRKLIKKIVVLTLSTVIFLIFCIHCAISQPAINQAMKTNGSGQSMEIGDNPNIAIPIFSVECWVKVQGAGLIVTRDHPTSTPSDWQVWYEHANKRIAFITGKNNVDDYFYTPNNSIVPDQWTHIAVYANGPAGMAKVYINGALIISPTFSSRNFDAVTGLSWGGYYNNPGGAYFKGFIDEARYWNIERSQSQIQLAKDATLASNDRQGLVGYWMFCGNFADSSGNGNHGVPKGNPQIVDVFDLPLGINCGPGTPTISASPLQFQTIICPYDAPRDSVVWVKNTGNADLTITFAQIIGPNASEFTLLSPPSVPPLIIIKPRDSLVIVIRFNPNGVGYRSASLVLESNASNGSPYTISLSGRKENITYTLSPSFINYGELQPGTQKLDSIRITNTGTQPIVISKQYFPSLNGFTLLTTFPVTIQPRGSLTIRIRFNGNLDGVYKSILTLRSLPCDSIIDIPLTASISRSYSFRRIICPNDQPRDTSVVIHNISDSVLTITRASLTGTNASDFSIVDPPSIPPQVFIQPGDSLILTVRYNPNFVGTHLAQLLVDILNPNAGTLHIPLSGIKEQFIFTINKTLVDFGQNQSIQLPKNDAITIRNNGTTQVRITQNGFLIGTGFKILTPLPIDLSPTQEKTIQIKFDSSVNGVYQSILKLESTVCDSFFMIPVIGNIISPVNFKKIQCFKDAFRDTSIVIHNFSDRDLEFTSAAFSGQDKNDFELVYPFPIPPVFAIPPRDSITFIIRFKPTVDGTKSAILNISYSCIVDGILQITLFGQKESVSFALNPSQLDFGIKQSTGLPARKFILIQNTGSLPLTIQKIDLTPLDTFTVLTKLPLTIQLGKQDSIWVEFNPIQDGVYRATAIVYYSPCDDTTMISIIGIKRHAPQISAEPLSFSSLLCANELQRDSTIIVKNIGTDTLIITNGQIIGTNASDFVLLSPATVPPVIRIAPNDSIPIQVRFTPSAFGDRSATLLLITNSINSNSYSIPLTGRKEITQLSVSATLLDFGNNQPSDLPREMMLIISNPGSIDRVITQASFSPQNAFTILTSLPVTVPAHGSISLLIRFNINTDGVYTSQLKIDISPCDTVINIQVTGARVNQPFIVSTIPDFGMLMCDNRSSRDTTIIIKNKGGENLVITKALIAGNDSIAFTIIPPIASPVTIPPGDSVVLRIRFSPTKIGLHQAQFRVESNAVNSASFNIILQGRKERTLLMTSAKLIDLGMLCPNEKRDSAFTVKNIGTISTSAVTEADAPITTTPLSFTIDTLQTTRVDFTFNGLAQEGSYTGLIRVRNQCDVIDTVQVNAMIAAPRIAIDSLVISVIGLAPVDGNLTIKNIGLRTVTITQWSLSDSRFVVIAPALPVQLDVGSSLNVMVRYSPTDTSSVQTTFRAQGNPCAVAEQSLVIATNSTQRLIYIDASSHGTLRCSVFQDTSMTIRNIGQLPVQISNAQITGVHANDFTLVNPVTIPPVQIIQPNDQLIMRVRFQPQAAGLRTAQLDMTSDATNTPFISLPLTGRKEDTRIALSDTAVNFGVLCPTQTGSKTILVSNNGSIVQQLSMSIGSLYTVSISSLSLQPGESDSVVILFAGGTNEGFYSSTFILKDECNVEHKIPFTTFIAVPKLIFNQAAFSCLVDSFEMQDMRIFNPTSRSIEINSWDIPDSRFTILSPSLPQVIPPNGDMYVQVKFAPTYPDNFSTTLNLHGTQCDFATQVPISAQAYEASATITLPIISASVDTSLSIPMNLLNAQYIQQSGAVSYRTRMRFNRTLLLPTGVHTNSTTATARMISNTTNDSDRVVEVEVIDNTPPNEGVILFLDCITGLGNAERTPLRIDQFQWTSGRVRTTTVDGEFISTGICREGGARLLNIPTNVRLSQNYPNPFSLRTSIQIHSFRRGEFTVSSFTNEKLIFKVYDVFGREVLDLSDAIINNREQRTENRELTIDNFQLPSPGIYFYRLTIGNESQIKMMTMIQ